MDFLNQLKNGVFTEMIARFSAAIPKLTFALLILLIGWLIAKTIRKVVRGILAGIGIDRVAERLNDIDLVQRSGVRVEISSVLAQMVYLVLMLGFIIFATDMLGIPAITQMVRDLIDYMPALFSAFVLLLLGLFLADMIRGIVQTACQSMGLPSAKMIATAVFYFCSSRWRSARWPRQKSTPVLSHPISPSSSLHWLLPLHSVMAALHAICWPTTSQAVTTAIKYKWATTSGSSGCAARWC
ncbi:MAG: hypothetical protein IPJ82_16775 [Lewinellaceae bacterium]|nr:hypothetical protein [Lewinellaceae bacterium]